MSFSGNIMTGIGLDYNNCRRLDLPLVVVQYIKCDKIITKV
jgi:hypothetical protein